MLRELALLTVLGASGAVTGCATIVHSGPRSIPVASTPPGATVTVYDRSNKVVLTDTTPFVARLSTRAGYFKAQNYRMVFEMPGHSSAEVKLDSTLSAWYFGNLVIGGLLGMLVVDPLTGAMYNLVPEKIEQTLSDSQARVVRDGNGLLVILASQATEAERAAMVRIN